MWGEYLKFSVFVSTYFLIPSGSSFLHLVTSLHNAQLQSSLYQGKCKMYRNEAEKFYYGLEKMRFSLVYGRNLIQPVH